METDAPPSAAVRILLDCFDRVSQEVAAVLDGLDEDQLSFRAMPDANSIAWLIWHLSRVQDDHIAGLAGTQQAWLVEGWAERFDLPLDVADIGYGHDSTHAGLVVVHHASLLADYFGAVHSRTSTYLLSRQNEDFQRVVDTSFIPPVTEEVRLVSVISDCLQHVGQAAFVRGLLSGSAGDD